MALWGGVGWGVVVVVGGVGCGGGGGGGGGVVVWGGGGGGAVYIHSTKIHVNTYPRDVVLLLIHEKGGNTNVGYVDMFSPFPVVSVKTCCCTYNFIWNEWHEPVMLHCFWGSSSGAQWICVLFGYNVCSSWLPLMLIALEIFYLQFTWWRHQMETFSALLALCVGNLPVSGEFPAQRPVTQSFDVFFDLLKRLSKHSRGWWFETLSRALWRHCNITLNGNLGK